MEIDVEEIGERVRIVGSQAASGSDKDHLPTFRFYLGRP